MVDLMSRFVQSNRLLKLTLAPGSGIDENVLLPYELSGTEGISEGVHYTLTCLSSDAFLELKQFIGLPTQIAILTDDGSERAVCGIVTRAEHQGSNGGFSRIALTLQDPFAILQKRINSRVFQDLTVREFTAILLQEHRQKNSVLTECFDIDDRCIGEHPKQSWVTQYNESDTAFLTRWLAQEGISWYFEHGDQGNPGEHPKLTLVLFDDASVLDPGTASKIRFHRDDGTETEDVITEWRGTRTLQPGSTERMMAVIFSSIFMPPPVINGEPQSQLELDVFVVLMTVPCFLACLYIFLKESFHYTHFPIRLNRKNRKVYIWRKSGVVTAYWDKVFFFLREYRNPTLTHWDVRGNILAEDGVTVIDSFPLSSYECTERKNVEHHFEYFRRYMEVGPEQTWRMLKVCLPIAKRKETWWEGLMCHMLSMHGYVVAQILMLWFFLR